MTRVPVRDDLRALEGYHSPQVHVDVRLNTNESPFAPPAAWYDAFAAELSRVEWHRYPDRAAAALRAGIAHLHQVRPDQVFVANGSNEVLQTLLLTFAGPGRAVATFEPTYQLHGHIARLTGASVLEGERAVDFSLDLAEVRRVLAAGSPVVTFLCSPNNPTGTTETRANVEAIVAAAVERGNTLVVIDEAYGEFADWTAFDLVADDVPLVVSRTYSKVWSLAALRLGFCIGPAAVIAELEKVVLPYHLSVATQLAGTIALDHVDEMEARVKALVDERHRLAERLRRLPGLTVFPSGANFLLVRPDGDGQALWDALVAHGVLVRNFSRWPRLEDCLRITVGTPDENDRCVAAITAALKEIP